MQCSKSKSVGTEGKESHEGGTTVKEAKVGSLGEDNAVHN